MSSQKLQKSISTKILARTVLAKGNPRENGSCEVPFKFGNFIKFSTIFFVVGFLFFSLNINSAQAAISFHAAAGSNNAGGGTTIGMTMPAVTNGDVLIMQITYRTAGYSPTTPSGWTSLSDVSNGTPNQSIYWRIALSEPASYTVTIPSGKASGTIISLSGASSVQPIAAQISNQQNTSSVTLTAATLGTFTSSNGIDLFLGGSLTGTTWASGPTNYTNAAQSASTGGNASTRTTSNVAYRALSAVTTVGSLTEKYSVAAGNIVHHIFITEDTTCTSQVVTGNWNTAGTWNCGHVPNNANSVTIRSGDTITMDVNSNLLNAITINGTLTTSGSNYSLTGNTLNIASTGTLTANGSTINLSGTTGTLFTKSSGTFNAGNSTVNLTSASGTQTISSGSPAFYNLSTSGGGTRTLGENLTVTGLTTIGSGTTLNQGATYNFTTGGLTVSSAGIYTNTGTGDLTLGGDVSNAGTITIKSNNSTSCTGTKDIVIASSDNATQRTWSGAGVFNINNVSVSYQTGSITAHDSTDGGHNGWTFNSACSVVVLNTPANLSSTSDTTPTLNFTGTSVDAAAIEYQVQVDTADTFDSQAGAPVTEVVTATGAGSWLIPDGVTSVKVELWGGGGGGSAGARGGGAGAYVIQSALSVTPGNSITYVIAEGGNKGTTSGGTGGGGYYSGGAGAINGTLGGAGGGGSTSVVVSGTTYVASGGGGGGWVDTAATAASGSSGGTGGLGYTNGGSGGGGGGGSGSVGGNASGITGGAAGTSGTTQTGINGYAISATGGGSSAGASGNGLNGSTSSTGANGSGGAAGGTSGNPGTAGSGSDSGGGGGNGGNGGQPGAGGGYNGNGGAGKLIITSVPSAATPLISASSATDAGFTDVQTGHEAETHPFHSGDPIEYTVQSPLTAPDTYYWRVRAARMGTEDYGAWTSPRSFDLVEGVTVAGFIYTNDAASTPFDCSGTNLTVKVAVNGVLASGSGSCTLNTGAFSVPLVPITGAGQIITVFIDTATSANQGVTITRSLNANAISSLPVISGRVMVRDEDGTSITNANLGTFDADNVGGGNIPFTSNSNNLILTAGHKLLVWAGKTFTPGGTVTTAASATAGNIDGDVLIQSGATLAMGTNTLSVGGDYLNSGTLTKSSGQLTTFTATGTGFTITPGTGNFDNVTFNGSGGAWALLAGTTLDANLTVTAGELATANYTVGANSIIINGGTLTAGTSTINLSGTTGTLFTKSSGTFNAGNSTVNMNADSAGTSWTTNSNSSGLHYWRGIASSSDGTKLAAVDGDLGYIYTSTNSGVTWTTNSNSSGLYFWQSITSSSDGTKLAAVDNNNGYIYTSTNSGVTWTTNSNSSGLHNWQSITSSSDGTKLAAGDYGGYIYTSTNSGVTWTTNSNSSGLHVWYSIASSSDGTKLAAVDNNNGYIYTSTNSGVTWTTNSNSSGLHAWYSIASSSDGTKLAAAVYSGYIYTSTDSGVTWTTNSNSSGVRNWNSIASSSDGTKLAAGVYGGYIYTSTDSGTTWSTNSNSSGLHSWSSIASSSDGTKLAAVVSSDYIYTSILQNVILASGSPSFYNLSTTGTGTINLGEDLTVTNALTISGGTFSPQSYTVNLTGTGTVFNYSSGTFTPGTSTFKLTNSSSNAKTFSGGGQTYNNIWIAPGSGTGSFTIAGSNTFNDFKDDGTAAHSILFTAGTTQTVSSWNVSGTTGNLKTLKSTSDGNYWSLSKSSGNVISDYLSLQDSHAIGGATFYAGSHSTNVSGNTGWIFSDFIIYTPTVITNNSTNLAPTTATGNGNVTSDGGATVTERGFVWNTATNPTTSNSKVIVSGTTGTFTGGITGLTENTLYYVRAYAINSAGTSYGSNDYFTTPYAQAAPTIVLNTTDAMTTSDTTPTLEMTASDVNNDDVEYNIQISTNSSFTAPEQWVATGGLGTNNLAHSTNGIDWTGDGASIFTTGSGNWVAYNGSMWVAVGVGANSIAYSYNGINWTGITGKTIFSTGGYGIAWNGTMWVATGQGTNTLAYSYNGIDWTRATGSTSIFSTISYTVAWNGTMWVATGQGTNSLAYSYNGIDWTGVTGSTTIFSGSARVVAWTGFIWVAGGTGTNALAHSTNGINWTGDGVGLFSSSVSGLAWNGSIILAGGNDTTKNFAYSSNGTSWTPVAGKTIFSGFVRGVSWNGNKFVATGSGTANNLAYSYNGTDWTGSGTSVLATGVFATSNSPVNLVPSISAPASFDKISTSDAGFLNTVTGGDTHPFNSGEKVSYTVQAGSELALGTYYWRARAIDPPNGTNTYSSWTTARSFTISNVPPFTLSNYRIFKNTNNTDVGSALSSMNTSATLSNSGDAFRLRLLMHIGTDLSLNGQNFKLQYSPKSGTCDATFTDESYQDVTRNTEISYHDNFYPEHNIALTSNANDPTHNEDTIVNQSYVESNNFTNSIASISTGQYGKWDFSLYDKTVSSEASYCLRIVKSDDSLLDTYSFIPEITTAVYRSRGGGGVYKIENDAATPDPIKNTGVNKGGGGDIEGGATPTPIDTGNCSDGIRNGNETGVDVGGRCGGGGGGGDLGYLFNKTFSIFNLINYPSLKNSLLAMVFNSF